MSRNVLKQYNQINSSQFDSACLDSKNTNTLNKKIEALKHRSVTDSSNLKLPLLQVKSKIDCNFIKYHLHKI